MYQGLRSGNFSEKFAYVLKVKWVSIYKQTIHTEFAKTAKNTVRKT